MVQCAVQLHCCRQLACSSCSSETRHGSWWHCGTQAVRLPVCYKHCHSLTSTGLTEAVLGITLGHQQPCAALLQDSPLALYLRGPMARKVAQVKEELLAGPRELQQQLAGAVDDFYERLQGIPELLGLDLGPQSEQHPYPTPQLWACQRCSGWAASCAPPKPCALPSCKLVQA